MGIFPSETIFHQNQEEYESGSGSSSTPSSSASSDSESDDEDEEEGETQVLKVNQSNEECIKFVKSLRNFKPNNFTYQLYQMRSRVKSVKHLADKLSEDDQSLGLVLYIKISKFLIVLMEKADNFVLNNDLEENKKRAVIEQMAALKRLFNTCYENAKNKSGVIKLMSSLKFTETRVIDPIKLIYEKAFELLNEAKKHHIMNFSKKSNENFEIVKYLFEFLLLDEEFNLHDLYSIYQLYLEIPAFDNNL